MPRGTAASTFRPSDLIPGAGFGVNQLEFEIYNQGGDDFELASVEFVVLPTGRRI